MQWKLLLSLLYRWGNWGLEKSNILAKVTASECEKQSLTPGNLTAVGTKIPKTWKQRKRQLTALSVPYGNSTDSLQNYPVLSGLFTLMTHSSLLIRFFYNFVRVYADLFRAECDSNDLWPEGMRGSFSPVEKVSPMVTALLSLRRLASFQLEQQSHSGSLSFSD